MRTDGCDLAAGGYALGPGTSVAMNLVKSTLPTGRSSPLVGVAVRCPTIDEARRATIPVSEEVKWIKAQIQNGH